MRVGKNKFDTTAPGAREGYPAAVRAASKTVLVGVDEQVFSAEHATYVSGFQHRYKQNRRISGAARVQRPTAILVCTLVSHVIFFPQKEREHITIRINDFLSTWYTYVHSFRLSQT